MLLWARAGSGAADNIGVVDSLWHWPLHASSSINLLASRSNMKSYQNHFCFEVHQNLRNVAHGCPMSRSISFCCCHTSHGPAAPTQLHRARQAPAAPSPSSISSSNTSYVLFGFSRQAQYRQLYRDSCFVFSYHAPQTDFPKFG